MAQICPVIWKPSDRDQSLGDSALWGGGGTQLPMAGDSCAGRASGPPRQNTQIKRLNAVAQLLLFCSVFSQNIALKQLARFGE